ncbi:hypothetical protein [Ruegeria sp. HKCCD8929]|uniref:hypothetical protein n=1 Tax=Ruegeria sp. HKCCD8929 TaxID=2683006 RepID=UPI001487E7C5|nr:hypothetical protein [Ruegeria sp. HKCCD8929]
MMTVAEITDAVGIRKFAKALGVKSPAISNMRSANVIPAKKYTIVCELCREHGLAAPEQRLFSFDKPSKRAA